MSYGSFRETCTKVRPDLDLWVSTYNRDRELRKKESRSQLKSLEEGKPIVVPVVVRGKTWWFFQYIIVKRLLLRNVFEVGVRRSPGRSPMTQRPKVILTPDNQKEKKKRRRSLPKSRLGSVSS